MLNSKHISMIGFEQYTYIHYIYRHISYMCLHAYIHTYLVHNCIFMYIHMYVSFVCVICAYMYACVYVLGQTCMGLYVCLCVCIY